MALLEPPLLGMVERISRAFIGLLLALVVIAMFWHIAHELNDPINGQDEAIVLLYADRLLDGDLAYSDYESVYPFGLGVLLALPVTLLGSDLLLIRVLPLVLALVLVSVLALRTRRILPALVLLVIVLGTWPEGALFWQYALLLFGVGLQLLLTRHLVVQGVGAFLIMFVVSVRLDFAIVVVPLVAIHLLHAWRTRQDQRFHSILIGYAVGTLPLLIQLGLIVAEPGIFEWIHIQRSIGQGRILPLTIEDSLDTLIVLIGGAVIMIAVTALTYHRNKKIPLFVVFATGGAGVLAVFQALRRFDAVHLYYALGLCAIAAAGITQQRSTSRSYTFVTLLGASLLLLPHVNAMQSLTPFFRLQPRVQFTNANVESRSLCSKVRCIEVEPRLADWYADALNLVSTDTTASVFIGPSDLRTANYSDDWLYLLLSNPVCSRFLEMNPGSSNRTDSNLETDIADCDFLVLTALYNMPIENEWARQEFAKSRHNNALSRFDLVYTNNVVFVYKTRHH